MKFKIDYNDVEINKNGATITHYRPHAPHEKEFITPDGILKLNIKQTFALIEGFRVYFGNLTYEEFLASQEEHQKNIDKATEAFLKAQVEKEEY